MTDLGRNARELLDLAAKADSAPAAHLPEGRRRLVATLAAGTVATTAVAAKGAALSAASSGAAAIPIAGTATSLVTTFVTAITIGISTGLVVVAPATRIVESPSVANRTDTQDRSAQLVSSRQIGTNAHSVAPSLSPSAGPVDLPVVAPMQVPDGSVAPVAASNAGTGPAEISAVPAVPSDAPRTLVASSETSPSMAGPPKPTRSSIAQETALLAEVQRALKGGRAMMALEALDRYAEQSPHGLLQEEATVSRVLALCALGRVQDARRWADEFLRRYPASPLLPRVRNACATGGQHAEGHSPND